MRMHVDCLKITEDKLSESKVYTSDARLVIATHAMAKTQSSKPVSQWSRRRARSPRLNG